MLPKNRRPAHPGEILRYEYLEPLGMSESQLSASLGVSFVWLKMPFRENAA